MLFHQTEITIACAANFLLLVVLQLGLLKLSCFQLQPTMPLYNRCFRKSHELRASLESRKLLNLANQS